MIAMFHISDIRESNEWTENQQIMFDYATQTVLPMISPAGVWMAPAERQPVTMEEVVRCFARIIEHESYQGQTMITADSEGAWITYTADGMVKVEPEAPNPEKGWGYGS
jgi:hypothetical protein